MEKSEKDWKETIAKLMAKAERTASPEEQYVIVEKITYLMAKHGIEEAMLNANQEQTFKLVDSRYRMANPYALEKAQMLHNISKAFGCETILIDDHTRVRVFGYDNDQEKVFMLYNSLLLQMLTGLASAVKPTNVHGKTFNSSWVKGYVNTVGQRVRAAYTRAQNDVRNSSDGSGMDLVLLEKSTLVRNALREEYPHIKSVRHGRATHAGAYGAGSAAGRSADIGQTRVGGKNVRAIGS